MHAIFKIANYRTQLGLPESQQLLPLSMSSPIYCNGTIQGANTNPIPCAKYTTASLAGFLVALV